MRPQKQLYDHNPPDTYGDCHRTAIACLLNFPVTSVPNFAAKHWDDHEAYNKMVDEYLAYHNLARVCVIYDGAVVPLEDILAHQGAVNPDAYYMLSGKSRNETNHVVIGLGSNIHWDPSPVDSGIIGPCDDGLYWIEYLVPLSMIKKAY